WSGKGVLLSRFTKLMTTNSVKGKDSVTDQRGGSDAEAAVLQSGGVGGAPVHRRAPPGYRARGGGAVRPDAWARPDHGAHDYGAPAREGLPHPAQGRWSQPLLPER